MTDDEIKKAAGEFTEALGQVAPRVLTQDGDHSSNIHWARYNPDTQQLEIDFKGKDGKKTSTYRYDGFTWENWRAFQDAPSKGQHFAFKIRPRFKGVKL